MFDQAVEKTPLELALDALARRDLTRAELVQRLMAQGFSEAEAEDAASRAEQMRLVDDTRTAQWEAEKALRNPGKGRLALERRLTVRGVDDSVTNQVVQNLSHEDERAKARRFVVSRAWKDQAQAARALASRGFDDETILAVIEELFPHD